jgi:hypothetical protein
VEISETKGTQATTMMLAAGKHATVGHTRLRVSGPNSDEKKPSTLSKAKNITRYPSQSHGLIPLRRQKFHKINFILRLIHGQINYIETNAKCRHLKKLTCKGTLRQVSEAQNPIPPKPKQKVVILRN